MALSVIGGGDNKLSPIIAIAIIGDNSFFQTSIFVKYQVVDEGLTEIEILH